MRYFCRWQKLISKGWPQLKSPPCRQISEHHVGFAHFHLPFSVMSLCRAATAFSGGTARRDQWQPGKNASVRAISFNNVPVDLASEAVRERRRDKGRSEYLKRCGETRAQPNGHLETELSHSTEPLSSEERTVSGLSPGQSSQASASLRIFSLDRWGLSVR